jgi:antitoxin CptB
MSDSEINRLRWRCRRGTRELDRLLTWYLEERYAQTDAQSRIAFAALLDAQDPDLWDWIMGHGVSDQPAFQHIIDSIRSHYHV